MAYATVSHVEAQDTVRFFTASSQPNVSQVVGYLEQTAVELDAVLRARGYALPVPAEATSVLRLLEHGNALGAAAMAAQAAVNSGGKADPALKLWESFKKALKAGEMELELGKDSVSGRVRSAQAPCAMFTTGMRH